MRFLNGPLFLNVPSRLLQLCVLAQTATKSTLPSTLYNKLPISLPVHLKPRDIPPVCVSQVGSGCGAFGNRQPVMPLIFKCAAHSLAWSQVIAPFIFALAIQVRLATGS